ncbi:MAG: LLM class flavin-dependent oxidoreductase, partial [Thermomicrobiaceae bacterium]
WARSIWPAQQHVPIYLAALGPKSLDLAARLADGLLVADFATIPFLEQLVPEMKTRIECNGRDPDAFHFYVRTGISVTDDSAAALRYRKTLMALLAPLPGMSRQIVHPDYDVAGIMNDIDAAMRTTETLEAGGNFIDLRSRADFQAARDAIPDGLIENVSYIGTADAIRAKLGRLQEIGVTHVFLSAPERPEADLFTQQIQALT